MKNYHIIRTLAIILHNEGSSEKLQIDVQPNIVEDLEGKRKQVIEFLYKKFQGTINKEKISISFTYETIDK